MKKIVLLASLTLIFTNCGRSNDNTNEIIVDPVAEVPALPTKVSGSYGVRTVKYDGNKLLEISSLTSKMVLEYTGGLITRVTNYKASGEKERTVELTYSNGNLTNVSSNGRDYSGTFSYSYPSANVINCTEIKKFTFSGLISYSKREITYTLNNGNIVSEGVVFYSNDKPDGKASIVYTYDDKNNTFKNILGVDKIKAFLSSEELVESITGNSNNILTMDITNISLAGVLTKYKFINNISYSANNYPIQIISKQYDANNQQQGNTITDFFEYNK
ncbi:hypothetical protein ATE49_01675 [Elizabethkingia miricola]|uniref:DUF4595 domain-containing protein n=1 Tax=Elizabethkingia miricola TaxID=172045 RepID=A0ABY3NK41_ELIMR|nr:hypothetical protein [Elizabethkingia miricola]NHQ68409.1 hypothetical protein [Elizabethkingia miricola]NHQ70965.1 hypothetical protein [Elizabethkingia miricola]NHQ79685.1 hypothetical protein [Elizabethkingia miricola]OBS14089.1 hypothetical protein ATE49_01675 [Elizabethkingia miricola]PSL89477.1 hypothetical protein C7V10_03985 [Elizabethkingia miricola]